jgi:hypothetical protein
MSQHVYVPNGSLWLGTTGATATGQFLAKRIRAVAGTYNLAVDTGGDDTQAPIVALDTPDGDDTPTGSVVMTATATDDTAVARVEFEVDNVVVGIATAPNQWGMFEATWDSSGHPNGLTVFRAIAYDTSDNSGTSRLDAYATARLAGPPSTPVNLAPPLKSEAPPFALPGTPSVRLVSAGYGRLGRSWVEDQPLTRVFYAKRLR